MNKEALLKSIETKKITFYSRTKKRLWTKGETYGNNLILVSVTPDCDNDTLLIQVKPSGPSCHLNTRSCFSTNDTLGLGILAALEILITERYQDCPNISYVAKLFEAGLPRIAQKVAEEGVELALASVSGSKEDVLNESADLLFHVLILLKKCHVSLAEIMQELKRRNEQKMHHIVG